MIDSQPVSHNLDTGVLLPRVMETNAQIKNVPAARFGIPPQFKDSTSFWSSYSMMNAPESRSQTLILFNESLVYTFVTFRRVLSLGLLRIGISL